MAFLDDEVGLPELWAITKEWGLKDTTKTLFGLDANAVPDTVFRWLGKYNQHWWRRRINIADTGYVEVQTGEQYNVLAGNTLNPRRFGFNNYLHSCTIQYSDEIQINQSNGTVTLVNPASVTFGGTIASGVPYSFPGKYIKGVETLENNIYYIGENEDISQGTNRDDGTTYRFYYAEGSTDDPYPDVRLISSQFKSEATIGEWELVHSSNRNAYPDSGITNNVEYEYLGIPFEKMPGIPKMETGSYIGTGTYGASNPNSLPFTFAPKVVFIFADKYYHNQGFYAEGEMAIYHWGNGSFYQTHIATNNYNETTSDGVVVSVSGNTMTWYHTKKSEPQMNEASNPSGSGTYHATIKYDYIAIG